MTPIRNAISPALAAANRLNWKLNVVAALAVLNLAIYTYVAWQIA